jgi:uncharacterized NAD(P)/FAD-binding protein YdhS
MHNVAICGGGASGLLLAAQLLRDRSCSVSIFDPAPLGVGLAYDTKCPRHLLNVPARNMSAFADDAAHFVRWLDRNYAHTYGGTSFVPRAIYGDYLKDIAASLLSAYSDRFVHYAAKADSVSLHGRKLYVTGSNGSILTVDRLVVATGHSRRTRAGLQAHAERYSVNDRIVVVGTGLTAVDAVLELRYNGHVGSIAMISTRGLLPHVHRITGDENEGWRREVDALRSVTNTRWEAMSLNEKKSFLRHVAPYWNVHRHRMAPEIARELSELLVSDALTVHAGRILKIETRNAHRVTVRRRGGDEQFTLVADRVIDCTGPSADLAATTNPLLRSMMADGALVPHPVGVGGCVASDGAFIGANDVPSRQLYGIGPVRFGTLYETTAIPEIREQARDLAQTLLSAA